MYNDSGSIYLISNTENDKVYIGQTINSLKQRLQEHISDARSNKKKMYLHKAIRKYGEDSFKIKELERCSISDLTDREAYYIDKYDSIKTGYNTALASDSYFYKRSHLDLKDIIDLYTVHFKSLESIAKKYNVGRYVITQELLKNGVKIRYKSKTARLKNSDKYK